MLDKIMEMVGGDALNEITSKAGISMDQAKQVLPLAQDSLQEGLLSQVTSGNTEGLLGMFNSVAGGNLAGNGIFGSIKGLLLKKIMTSIGLPESVAGLVAGTGMTSIIGSLAGKMQDDGDNDGIDAGNIMNILGVGGGAAGMLGSLLGGESKGDGGLLGGLTDAAGDLLGGDKKNDDKGGGLIDGLKGMFGK